MYTHIIHIKNIMYILKKKKKKGRIGYVLGERNKFLPGPDGTPIWAPINLPPKTRAYKCLDILGNKLIAGK